MKKIIFSLLACILLMGFKLITVSELDKAPSRIPGVPIDILNNQVNASVSEDLKSIIIKSKMTFKTQKFGEPAFLLGVRESDIKSVKLNGEEIILKEVGQYWQNDVRIEKEVPPGTHVLEYEGVYRRKLNDAQLIQVNYAEGKFVDIAFPANSRYDFYPLELSLEVESDKEYRVISNAEKTLNSELKNNFKLLFPKNFNSSFFHIDLIKKEEMILNKTVKSVNGNAVDIMVYGSRQKNKLNTYLKETLRSFHFLESKLGAYPYNKIIVKALNSGGYAYAATMLLDESYLEDDWFVHELAHSWFLKGLSPVTAYDGWFHEGFGEWARFGFPRAEQEINWGYFKDLSIEPNSNEKIFPAESWHIGRVILSALDKRLEVHGGLLKHMKSFHTKYKGSAMGSLELKRYLEEETGEDLSKFFEHYFYIFSSLQKVKNEHK